MNYTVWSVPDNRITKMTDEAWQDLIASAQESLKTHISNAYQTYGIGEFERFDCDLPTGRIWWSTAGEKKVEADMVIVGTISGESGTWLWGWGNPHLNGVPMEEMDRVISFGEENGIEKLTSRQWPAEEVDGWEMTALAAQVLQAEAAYRCPSGKGFLFVLLNRIRKSSFSVTNS